MTGETMAGMVNQPAGSGSTVRAVALDQSTLGPQTGSAQPQWSGTTYINNGNAGRPPLYGIDPDALVSDPALAGAAAYTGRFRNNPNVQGSESTNGNLQTGQNAGLKVLTPEAITWSGVEIDRVTLSRTAAAALPLHSPRRRRALLPASALAGPKG